MDKLSEDISKSVLFYEFTKQMTFETYHIIEAEKRYQGAFNSCRIRIAINQFLVKSLISWICDVSQKKFFFKKNNFDS
jgi:hypothetical protein